MYLKSDIQLFKKRHGTRRWADPVSNTILETSYKLCTFNNYLVISDGGMINYRISDHMLKTMRDRYDAHKKAVKAGMKGDLDPVPEVFPYPFEQIGQGLKDNVEVKGNTSKAIQVVGLPEGDYVEIFQSVTGSDYMPATKDGITPFIFQTDDVDHIIGEDNGYNLGAMYYKYSPEDVNTLIIYYKP